jgi:hypothetical protein
MKKQGNKLLLSHQQQQNVKGISAVNFCNGPEAGPS